MKLSNLKKVKYWEFEEWLDKKINLTDAQKRELHHKDLIKNSDFYIYVEGEKEKHSPFWRLTLPLLILCYILMVVFMPIKWIFTGKWYYKQKFLDKSLYPWAKKLGL